MEKWFTHFIAKANGAAEWRLIGSIGQWREINSRDFNAQLSTLESKHKTIDMVIHSAGGEIYEGIAMYNRALASKSTINVSVEGMSASMASVLAMAGSHRRIAKHARMMIHQGMGSVSGSGNKLIKTGQVLNALNDILAEIYAEAIQHKHPERDAKWVMENWMKEGEDKWFTAEEAVEAGLMHEVYTGAMKALPVSADLNYDQLVAFYDNSLTSEISEDEPPTNSQKTTMKKEQIILMLAGLGITFDETVTASMSDEDFLAAMKAEIKKLKAVADKVTKLEGQLAAQAGTALDDAIKAAVKDGRITAKQEEHYRKLGEKLGAEETIAALKEIEAVAEIDLKRSGGKTKGIPADRKDWTHKQWAEKDPEGLKALMNEEPEAYEALVDKI